VTTGSPYNVNGKATGVAWWETDHSQLDYCYFNGTSNVWSTTVSTPASYVPFTYPHPLVTGGGGGTPIPTFSPIIAAFGYQPVLQASHPISVTLRNTGTANYVVSQWSLNNNKYSIAANTCGTPSSFLFGTNATGFTLAPGATCTFNVVYYPAIISQTDPGSVIFFDNTAGTFTNLTFSGTAVPPPVSGVGMFASLQSYPKETK